MAADERRDGGSFRQRVRNDGNDNGPNIVNFLVADKPSAAVVGAVSAFFASSPPAGSEYVLGREPQPIIRPFPPTGGSERHLL